MGESKHGGELDPLTALRFFCESCLAPFLCPGPWPVDQSWGTQTRARALEGSLLWTCRFSPLSDQVSGCFRDTNTGSCYAIETASLEGPCPLTLSLSSALLASVDPVPPAPPPPLSEGSALRSC